MSRIQLALNVDDLTTSIAFYSKLFGIEPAKTAPGTPTSPSTTRPSSSSSWRTLVTVAALNHLGIEVADVDTVDAEQARLAEHGLATVDERDTTCCYAKQDKFWVQGTPNGERWEIYTVLADSPTFRLVDEQAGSGCCGTDASTTDVTLDDSTAGEKACC